MWETQEEVRSAMLELKMFDTMEVVGQAAEGEEEEEESDECSPQVFAEHTELEERFTRSMYYGAMPATDRPSLPLTRIAVDQFTSAGLDALGAKLGRLDMARAADMTRQACAGPNSLVLALLYLDRLRRRNPDYLTTVSSADLFLVSLMVASKFLHDDGEEDEVFNDEWATSGGIDTKELNRLELSFLAAIDWRIFVAQEEFRAALHRVETEIAVQEMTSRGSGTYSDLTILSSGESARQLLNLLAAMTAKMTAVCLATYAAGLLTLLGTAHALSRTPIGPLAVTNSLRTLGAACSLGEVGEDLDALGVSEEPEMKNLTAGDLVTASLLVATLTSAPLVGEPREEEQRINRTRALWLAEYSSGTLGRAQEYSGTLGHGEEYSSGALGRGQEGGNSYSMFPSRPPPSPSSPPDSLELGEKVLEGCLATGLCPLATDWGLAKVYTQCASWHSTSVLLHPACGTR